MEVLATAAVAGLGYFFSKNDQQRHPSKPDFAPEKAWNKPNGKNIYYENRALQIRKDEQKKADALFEKSKNSEKTNVMVAGPPVPVFNKTDYTESKLPIEFRDSPYNIGNVLPEHNLSQPGVGFPTNSVQEDTGGWQGIPLNYSQGVSLTGEPMNPKDFKHNNMVPFFGSKVRQNVDQGANETLLETFNGTNRNYREKTEVKTMFKPEQNVGNVYGMSNLAGYDYDRYIVSNKRNNETPVEKIYVGPGLNKGYTAAPSGGIQQAETRDYVLPKKTNELRVKTNPKLSYYGRIVAGKHISRPGKVGNIMKNKPDTFFVNGPDRYFTTVGACTGPTQRGRIAIKPTNRKTTGKRRRIGPAGPTTGSKGKIRSKYRISNKTSYQPDTQRNAGQTGKWTINETKSAPNDYGRGSISNNENRRSQLSINHRIAAPAAGGTRHTVPVTDKMRQTRKQNVVGNTRWASNIQAPVNRHTVYDPNDVARTTIKETNIENNRTGNVGGTFPSKGQAYDPNDVARTTIKETNIENNRTGNVGAGQVKKGLAYDPNDVVATTMKETTMLTGYVGDAQGAEDGGYKIANPEARNTNRQFTADTEYVGDAQGRDVGGYQVANPEAPNTNRQFTADTEYVGGANADHKKSVSLTATNNATTKSEREVVARGRRPGTQGPKNAIGAKNINARTKKLNDVENRRLGQRGFAADKIYNSLPQVNKCSVTKGGNRVSNKAIDNRLDPGILDAFVKNPYTQSLKSFFY